MSSAGERPATASASAQPSVPAQSNDDAARAAAYRRDIEEGRYEEGRASVWVGRVLAGTLMVVSGIFDFMVGLSAVTHGSFFVYRTHYEFNWTTKGWGWTELVVGLVVLAVGVCLLLGMLWARVVAVIMATASLLANFLFIPFYPLWAIVVIAIDLFIIWACVARTEPRQVPL